jgi:hypothetical protein
LRATPRSHRAQRGSPRLPGARRARRAVSSRSA